jgi:FAS-associated factor 2
MQHIEHQLLPRVNPFLTRFKSQLQEREKDRVIREQQDRAFQESAERDRQRIQARIRSEQEEAERERLENEARCQEVQRMQLEREKQANLQALRLQYRRWMRKCIVPTEHRGANGIRLALKLPGNTRVVRTFSPSSTLTELYAFVDTQMLPLTLQPETDPEHILEGPEPDLQKLDSYIQSQANDAASWWGFNLVLSYPRREVKWTTSASLMEAGLKSGEQLVMELTDGSTKSQHISDDDYESEDD